MKLRFQFRLRTLLIVVTLFAIPCGFVAHEAKIVARRKVWLVAHSCYFKISDHVVWSLHSEREHGPSLVRLWLGDEPRGTIEVWDSASDEDIKLASSLFPEADIRDPR